MKPILAILLGGLLALGATSPASAQETLDHVVIVLDASGSMGTKMSGTTVTRMAAAQSALKQVLQQVSESTQVGLLVFNGKGKSEDWAYPLGPRRLDTLDAAIDSIRPNGGTPLGAFIKRGADRLLEAREKQFGYGTYRLLVVTDGEADDPKLVDRYAPEVVSRGIVLDAIGVDMKQNHTLATKVHTYRSANDPESLKQAIEDVFAEVATGTSDAAGEDAFAVLAPIPVATAAAAIQALATSGNEPIGSKPRGQAAAAPAASGSSTPVGPAPAPASPPVRDDRHKGGSWFIFIIVTVLILKALGGSGKKSRG